MSNPEIRAIEHANEWLEDRGIVSREDLMKLAEDAEGGDIESQEALRQYAEDRNIDWEDNYEKMAQEIALKIESATEDDPLGNELE